MPQFKTEQDYLDAGVTPPERIPHGLPGDDNEDLTNIIAATGSHKHNWYVSPDNPSLIECNAGMHPHGHGYDHLNQRLVGTSREGHPIFEPITLAENRPDYQRLLKQVDKKNETA